MMQRSINIQLDDAKFEKLDALKEQRGLTWEGMLTRGWEGELFE